MRGVHIDDIINSPRVIEAVQRSFFRKSARRWLTGTVQDMPQWNISLHRMLRPPPYFTGRGVLRHGKVPFR